MPEVQLQIQGVLYEGWTSARVTRTMAALAGSFELQVHDRYGATLDAWPIQDEDAARILVGGETLIDGFVDQRSLSLSATDRRLSVSGRDKAAVLVDCSVPSGPWTFRNISVLALLQRLAGPYGVTITLAQGLTLPLQKKVVIRPGEKPFEVATRILREVEALLVSDGRGGATITRAGTSRAESLTEGVNILSAEVRFDATQRFRRYVVLSQKKTSDETGQRIRAEATDVGVRRANRTKVLRPERGQSVAEARARADWEARLAAARGEAVTVTVQGWVQRDGTIWPVNALTTISLPSLGVAGELLIESATHTLDDRGSVTQLQLVRPDAFRPAETAMVENPEWRTET